MIDCFSYRSIKIDFRLMIGEKILIIFNVFHLKNGLIMATNDYQRDFKLLSVYLMRVTYQMRVQ
jgi:hypothetical protein